MEIKIESKGDGKEAVAIVEGEGNFLANAIRGELNSDKNVVFAAAKPEHPLKKTALVSVKVSKGKAVTAMVDAAKGVASKSKEFGKKFTDEYK